MVGDGVGGILISSGISSTVSVVDYYELDDDRLDASWFWAMRFYGDLVEMCDHSGARIDTAVSACVKRWKPWGSYGAAECVYLSSETDMRFAPMFAEAVYDCTFSEAIASLIVKSGHQLMHEDSAPASRSVELMVLRWILDDL